MYLRDLRRAKHWTQVQLAERTGVPQNTISRLERQAGARPGVAIVMPLARIFRVAPELIQWGCPPVRRPAAARRSRKTTTEVQP